jgi:hypothetical protein
MGTFLAALSDLISADPELTVKAKHKTTPV